MITSRLPRRALASALGLGLALTTVSLTPGNAAADNPETRRTVAPQVAYPLAAGKAVRDLRSYTKKKGFTEIAAPCGRQVRSVVPGTAQVLPRTLQGARRYVVRVHAPASRVWVGTAYLSRTSVKTGDVVTPGQALGTLGKRPSARRCLLQLKVRTPEGTVNPTAWLDRSVGRVLPSGTTPAPVSPPSPTDDAPGFTVASFNLLGAKHTVRSKTYATYPSRFNRAMQLLDDRDVDVVGLQEMHREQADYFAAKGYDRTWGIFHYDPPGPARDTDNAILYRKSTMQLVEGHTFPVPYFYGKNRAMPAVRLLEKATGKTAWFVNVHNPASSKKRGDHSKHRARAVDLERKKVASLRVSTGDPVFLTGDFNDNEKAYCPITSDGLMFSANFPEVPVDGSCHMVPRFWSIDWIFAAGDMTLSNFSRDMWAKQQRINDHPVIFTSVLLD